MGRVRIFGGGLFVFVTLVVACAKGTSGDTTDDADAAAPDDGGGRDVFVQPKDVGVQDAPGPDDGGDCTQTILINELEPDGTGGAEFIEIYNPGPCAVPLDGWHVEYRSSADNQGPPLHAFQTGDSIGSKTYYVLGNQTFANTAKVDVTITGGMGNSGGQIALTDGAGKIIDAVGYGTITGGKTFTEGSAAAVPATGKSLARTPNATDTNDNSKDFKVATPSPGVAN